MPAFLNKITENTATNLKTRISKSKTLSAQFYCICRIYIKVTTFVKKSEPGSLSVLEVIECKMRETLMHRRFCIRTCLGSERVGVSQTLHKYVKAKFSSKCSKMYIGFKYVTKYQQKVFGF